MHRDHADPDGCDENGDDVQFGALHDYNPDEDEEEPEHLLVCCGTKRPRGKAVRLVVKPAASGNEIVTVHDYLSTVHHLAYELARGYLGGHGRMGRQAFALGGETHGKLQCAGAFEDVDKAIWIRLRKKSS